MRGALWLCGALPLLFVVVYLEGLQVVDCVWPL